MPDYQVKNVEPIAVGTDIQVRVFTLTDGDVIPGIITARPPTIILFCVVSSPSRPAVPTIATSSLRAKGIRFCLAPPTAFRMNWHRNVSFYLSKEWVNTTGTRLI